MITIDVVCPLCCADNYIDQLIADIQKQENVTIGNVIFALTEEGDTSAVKNRISSVGYTFFLLKKKSFPIHSRGKRQFSNTVETIS